MVSGATREPKARSDQQGIGSMENETVPGLLKHEVRVTGPILLVGFAILLGGALTTVFIRMYSTVPSEVITAFAIASIVASNGYILWKVPKTPKFE